MGSTPLHIFIYLGPYNNFHVLHVFFPIRASFKRLSTRGILDRLVVEDVIFNPDGDHQLDAALCVYIMVLRLDYGWKIEEVKTFFRAGEVEVPPCPGHSWIFIISISSSLTPNTASLL